MDENALVEAARIALSSGARIPIDEEADVPDCAGLYAIYGSSAVWEELGVDGDATFRTPDIIKRVGYGPIFVVDPVQSANTAQLVQ